MANMNCEKCGNELQDGALLCKSCGHPLISHKSPKHNKKKKGYLIGLLSFFGVVGIILISIAVFLPGFFGPRNLGIKTSKAAYESAITKLNYQKDKAPSTGTAEDYTYTYGELKVIETSLNSEELTSFFNFNRPKYYALKQVQIRINPDNTIEFSAVIDTSYFLNKVLEGQYSEKEITDAFPFIKVIPSSVNVYAHFSGEVINNKSSDFAFSKIEVMGINLPSNLYNTSSAKTEIRSILNNYLKKITEKTNATYSSIKVENSELQISGNLPSSLTREKVN